MFELEMMVPFFIYVVVCVAAIIVVYAACEAIWFAFEKKRQLYHVAAVQHMIPVIRDEVEGLSDDFIDRFCDKTYEMSKQMTEGILRDDK